MDKIVYLAVIIEGFITWFSEGIQNKKVSYKILLSIVLSVSSCVAFNFNVFADISTTTIMMVFGQVLTGLIVARGSNYVFDMVGGKTNV